MKEAYERLEKALNESKQLFGDMFMKECYEETQNPETWSAMRLMFELMDASQVLMKEQTNLFIRLDKALTKMENKD